MYTLLAGYAPFYHRQQLRMMRMIQEGKYEFAKEQWDSVSEDAKDLVWLSVCLMLAKFATFPVQIRRLLTVDAKKRTTAGECLQHPWFAAAGPTKPEVIEEAAVAKKKLDYRRLFRIAQISVRFMCRIQNMKYLKSCIDRTELRKRPFRNREVQLPDYRERSCSHLLFRSDTRPKRCHSLSTAIGSTADSTTPATCCSPTGLVQNSCPSATTRRSGS